MKGKADFFKVLSWLLRSGLPLYQALELMTQQGGQKIVSGLLESIRAGNNFSEAIRQSGRFRSMEYHAVMAGENSGALADKLLGISRMIEREQKMRRALTDAMSYPLIVMLTALGSLIVMSTVLTPMLMEISHAGGQSLPALTRALIGFSKMLPALGLGIAILLPVAVIVLHLLFRNPGLKLNIWRLLLRMPIAGDWIRRTAKLSLCLNLAMLVEAGIPLHTAFRMLSGKGSPYPYRVAMAEAAAGLLSGMSIHQTLSDRLLFDPLMLHLLKAAEKSGELLPALHSLAAFYEEELARQATLMRNRLEPLMIALSGVIVALVVTGFYLPMFELGGQMGR